MTPARAAALLLVFAGATTESPLCDAADSFVAAVVAVHDGDTISVLRSGHERIRIRLDGIDCPELHQAYGRRAKRATADLIFGRQVTVVPVDEDAYGRLVARIRADGEDVALTLVRRGLAWQYRRYSHDRALADAEREARAARVGLWADPHPVPPWEWRREHPRD